MNQEEQQQAIQEIISVKGKETFDYLKHSIQTLPHFLTLKEDTSYLNEYVNYFKKFEDVLIFGIGGSSLGGQALCALSTSSFPHLHFIDNIDAYHFKRIIEKCDPLKTGIIVISKSGNTVETLMQLMTLREIWKEFNWVNHSLCITEDKHNALREYATALNMPCLNHPLEIGGRFSVFTIVGLLPALICGIDVESFKKGAIETLEKVLESNIYECPPLLSVIQQYVLYSQGVNKSIFFVYSERLRLFGAWFAQLWAESLGKIHPSGHAIGFTPICAVGTVDQHSQLQLYLDGPKDKYFTIFTLNVHENLPCVHSSIDNPIIQALDQHTMDELMRAEQLATIQTMQARGCWVRHIPLEKLSERELGSLMMHFILETLCMAHLFEINPFDQPAVEQGKILAIRNLSLIE